jgi:hypothetical protein
VSADGAQGTPPVASLRPLRRRSWAWVLPVLALALAVVLGGRAWSARGPVLLLSAQHGHGIGPGDLLLYRGIAVGDVRQVELAQDLQTVELRVRLDPAAERIARAGSRFWVVRPHITLDRLRGVETLLGARHLAVLPGSPDAPVQRTFVCLEEAPVLTGENEDEEALEFVLEAPLRFGLSPGAPLTYRQIEVGAVVAVGLSSDARSVEVRCRVRGPYASLVREDTRFWESGGLEFSLELMDGLSIDVESLRSLVVGGIAFASPTRPGPTVKTGHRFTLAADPEEEWLEWSPSLPVGGLSGTSAPGLLRARLAWEEGLFDSAHSRSGWVLPLSSGLVGPRDLLVAPEDAEGPALEVRGQRLPLLAPPEAEARGLARRALAWPEVEKWPAAAVRTPAGAEDCLVIGDPGSAPTALAAARLEADEGQWRVDPAISFDASWHGAAVLARSDGLLIGLLLVVEGRGSVAPLGELVD